LERILEPATIIWVKDRLKTGAWQHNSPLIDNAFREPLVNHVCISIPTPFIR
jgi:hypothetical protein